MIVTLYPGDDDCYVTVGSGDVRLRSYNNVNDDGDGYWWVNIDANDIYRELAELSRWSYDALGETLAIVVYQPEDD